MGERRESRGLRRVTAGGGGVGIPVAIGFWGAEPADIFAAVVAAVEVRAGLIVGEFGGDAAIAPGDERLAGGAKVGAGLQRAARTAATVDPFERFGERVFLNAAIDGEGGGGEHDDAAEVRGFGGDGAGERVLRSTAEVLSVVAVAASAFFEAGGKVVAQERAG